VLAENWGVSRKRPGAADTLAGCGIRLLTKATLDGVVWPNEVEGTKIAIAVGRKNPAQGLIFILFLLVQSKL
jgi:hypothetical protein